MAKKHFYITTTAPYVNADPHIGFALEIVQADAIARFNRLIGNEVAFGFGTDEHGLKIYRKAGVPITFSSDSHDPRDVGRDYDRAATLAKEAGYTEYSVFAKRKVIRREKIG